MARLDPGFVALLIGLLNSPAAPGPELPAVAVVAADVLEVFDEPDDRSVSTGQLQRGDEVAVRRVGDDGWLVIDPPPGSFVWVEQSALRGRPGATQARIGVEDAVFRAGHPGARMPGIRQGTMPKGTTVQLIDRPPLTVGRPVRTWRAVEPPTGSSRFIRAEGVEWRKNAGPAGPPPQETETRAAFLAEAPLPSPPAGIAAEINRLESAHRAVLRGPVDQWQLDSVRQGYQALQKRAPDPASARAIRARLDQVARHQAAAEAARAIEATLDRSRERDRKLTLYLRRLAEAEDPQERPYDAMGMLQPSSRKVGGEKLFALIGAEGRAVAYLNLPAGLDPRPYLTRPVGVRGAVHYDDSLHSKLIVVRDIDPLDVDR